MTNGQWTGSSPICMSKYGEKYLYFFTLGQIFSEFLEIFGKFLGGL